MGIDLNKLAQFWLAREHARGPDAAAEQAAEVASTEQLVKKAQLARALQELKFGPADRALRTRLTEAQIRNYDEPNRAAATAKPPDVGSFTDFIVRKYGSSPTPEQIAEGRRIYGRADDKPTATAITPTAESNILNRLVQQWDKAIAPARELTRQAKLMGTGLAAARRGDMAAGSQAVLVTFQKILDPTSVVRESEYARSAAGQAALARIQGFVERLQKGGAGVPLAELEAFAKVANEMVKASAGGYTNAVKARIGRAADRYKIPHDLVFDDYDYGAPEAAPAAPTVPTSGAAAPRVYEFDAQGNRIK